MKIDSYGARLTSIVKTSPIQEIIEQIEAKDGVILDEANSRIDQIEGAKQAFELSFKCVAVSIAGFQAKTISEIRKFEANAEANVLIFFCLQYIRGQYRCGSHIQS